MAGAGLGLDVARRRPALDPADRCRGTKAQYPSGFPRALASLHERDRPLKQQVLWNIPGHRRLPPLSLEESEFDLRAARESPCNCSDLHLAESALEDAIDKVKTLPEERQQYAAQVLEQIAEAGADTYLLSDEERRLVREGLADLDTGRVVSDADMATFWNRNRA